MHWLFSVIHGTLKTYRCSQYIIFICLNITTSASATFEIIHLIRGINYSR